MDADDEVEVEDLDGTVAVGALHLLVAAVAKSGQLQHSPEPLHDHEFGRGVSFQKYCAAFGSDANEPIETQNQNQNLPRCECCGWSDCDCQTMTMKPMRPDLSRPTRNYYHYCSSAVPHWSFVQCLDCRPLLLMLSPPLDCAAAAAAVGGCDCSSSAESCSMRPRQNLRVRRCSLDLPADGLQRHSRWVSFEAGREVEETEK